MKVVEIKRELKVVEIKRNYRDATVGLVYTTRQKPRIRLSVSFPVYAHNDISQQTLFSQDTASEMSAVSDRYSCFT